MNSPKKNVWSWICIVGFARIENGGLPYWQVWNPKFIYSVFVAVVTLPVALHEHEGVKVSSQTKILSVQGFWTMFRLSTHDENKWSLLDAHDDTVFVGTLLECEDWLDRMENVQRSSVEKQWVVHRAFRSLLAFFSRKSRSSHQSTSSKNPDEVSDRSSSNQSKHVSRWLIRCSWTSHQHHLWP